MNLDVEQYQKTLKQAFTKHYLENSDVWSSDFLMRSFPPLIQGVLKLESSARTLDIGCGAGYDTAWFASVFDFAMGIDICPHPDWKQLENKHTNISFQDQPFETFTADGLFDIILDNGCFHHQHPDQYSTYLKKIRSLLSLRGCFALSTFKNDKLGDVIDQNGRLHKYFKDEELHTILEAAGLSVLREFDMYRINKKDYYRFTLIKANA